MAALAQTPEPGSAGRWRLSVVCWSRYSGGRRLPVVGVRPDVARDVARHPLGSSIVRDGSIAGVRQPPNGKAGNETQAGCQKNRLGRISSNQLPRLADCPFQVMRLDVRSGPVELACRVFREVVDRFRTLANRGRSGMAPPAVSRPKPSTCSAIREAFSSISDVHKLLHKTTPSDFLRHPIHNFRRATRVPLDVIEWHSTCF